MDAREWVTRAHELLLHAQETIEFHAPRLDGETRLLLVNLNAGIEWPDEVSVDQVEALVDEREGKHDETEALTRLACALANGGKTSGMPKCLWRDALGLRSRITGLPYRKILQRAHGAECPCPECQVPREDYREDNPSV